MGNIEDIKGIDALPEHAARAVEYCKIHHQINLDWSRESLRLLDALLLSSAQIDSDRWADLGSYFGLMIQKSTGWQWAIDSDGDYHLKDERHRRADGTPQRAYPHSRIALRIMARDSHKSDPVVDIESSLLNYYDFCVARK